MGRDTGEQGTPDLFSTTTVRDASLSPPRPTSAVKTPTLPHRYVLSKNLGAAVKQLSDGELDHQATTDRCDKFNTVVSSAARLPDQTVHDGQVQTTTYGYSRRHVDPWSGECRSLSLQGWHHSVANCTTVRLISNECAKGVGLRLIEKVKGGSEFCCSNLWHLR